MSHFPGYAPSLAWVAPEYWTGAIQRAPRIMRILGLEWFWRLCLEPARFKRIWTAVIVFPFLVIKDFVEMKHPRKAKM